GGGGAARGWSGWASQHCKAKLGHAKLRCLHSQEVTRRLPGDAQYFAAANAINAIDNGAILREYLHEDYQPHVGTPWAQGMSMGTLCYLGWVTSHGGTVY
ncbi:hypothetical protein HaLaN_26393, partial [Haematococcus lacustris]